MMRHLVWILVAGVLAGTVAASFGCREAEEELVPDGTPLVSVTTAPTTTATVIDPTVPPDWATYTDPAGRFTLHYPPAWFVSDSSASTATSPGHLVATFSTFAAEGGGGISRQRD